MYALVAARAWRFETTELAMMQTFSQSEFRLDQLMSRSAVSRFGPVLVLHQLQAETAQGTQDGRVRANLLCAQVRSRSCAG